MGRFLCDGKSASGKDTIYKELRERIPELKDGGPLYDEADPG